MYRNSSTAELRMKTELGQAAGLQKGRCLPPQGALTHGNREPCGLRVLEWHWLAEGSVVHASQSCPGLGRRPRGVPPTAFSTQNGMMAAACFTFRSCKHFSAIRFF